MLWKANMDVQFVSEESLALSQYVTSYITKAEKSHMQETWQEIADSGNTYSRLWSFGLRMMRARECGLYEAADILLGDHLHEKSDAMQWVGVQMPDNRKRRLKDYRELQNLEQKARMYSNLACSRHITLRDRKSWTTRVSTSLWSITIITVPTLVVTGTTRSGQSPGS